MHLKSFEEESIVNVVHAIRGRREPDPGKVVDWYKASIKPERFNENRLARFVHEYTTGRVFFNINYIAFEKEEDFIIYKMWFSDGN